jgi:hypothetical protein
MKLARETTTVQTEFGDIRVKSGLSNGKLITAKPEYSDCSAAAESHKVTLKTVNEAAMKAFWAQADK